MREKRRESTSHWLPSSLRNVLFSGTCKNYRGAGLIFILKRTFLISYTAWLYGVLAQHSINLIK